ncbi:hypothetical protein CCR75_005917 [Bremia lactucae]|uniref:Uncharacterized protein n=1 Tax=Bremia lactucae TaxID=4779 RepID=A0A976P022_BRELC|nr:hypothetical protein CCR75_005917 [Bremia lactucae]
MSSRLLILCELTDRSGATLPDSGNCYRLASRFESHVYEVDIDTDIRSFSAFCMLMEALVAAALEVEATMHRKLSYEMLYIVS